MSDIKIGGKRPQDITVHDERFIIADTFRLYAQGNKTMSEVADFLFAKGVKTDGKYHKRNGKCSVGGKLLKDDRVKKIMINKDACLIAISTKT